MDNNKLSVSNMTFWDMWLQKIFRNLASMKFQMLLLLYIPVIIGIFSGHWAKDVWVSKIDPKIGLGFLGGGYVTLALGRVYARTKLTENNSNHLDCDK